MVSDAVFTIIGMAIKQMAPLAMEVYDLSQKESFAKKQFGISRQTLEEMKTTLGGKRFDELGSRSPKRGGRAKCTTCGVGSGLKEVGHASWNAMHGAAKMYTESPTPAEQVRMRAYTMGIIENFPCLECVDHSKIYLAEHPLDFTSRAALESSLCQFHDAVNLMKGKPLHGCK